MLFSARSLLPKLARNALPALLCLVAADACKKAGSHAQLSAYVDGGVQWAIGAVQLTAINGPSAVVVARQAAVQKVDGSSIPWTFTLVGATQPGDTTSQHTLQYVDYDPTQDQNKQLLAFSYALDYTQRAGHNDMYDVWVVLKKPSVSYYKLQKVWIGSADFTGSSGPVALSYATNPQLKLSQIAAGVFAGQWAVHYPDVQNYIVQPWQGMCPKTVTQAPGQTPGQNPGQFASCKPLPAKSDLCGGNPTQQSCRPAPPVQTYTPKGGGAPVAEPQKSTYGLTVVSTQQAVYTMPPASSPAKVVFVSSTITPASEADNSTGCADQFYALARTADRQLNASCKLKPAPAAMQNGHLTCGLTVEFAEPQTYLEKVCNISAVFRGDQEEVQHLQVLVN